MFKLPKPALTVIFLCFGVANVAAEVGKPLTAFAMHDGVDDTYRSADFDGSSDVDFLNFVSFAQTFDGTDPAFDLDANGRVDFGDLIIFAKSFDRPLGCTV